MATVEEKLGKGKEEKEKGNVEFKNGNLVKALRFYHQVFQQTNEKAVLYLTGLDNSSMSSIVPGKNLEEGVKKEIADTLKACYSNMAACYLKQSKYEKAIDVCEKVIKIDPQNAKAYFRRGQSHHKLNNLEKARTDLFRAAELAPQDAGIRAELNNVNDRLKELEEKSKQDLIVQDCHFHLMPPIKTVQEMLQRCSLAGWRQTSRPRARSAFRFRGPLLGISHHSYSTPAQTLDGSSPVARAERARRAIFYGNGRRKEKDVGSVLLVLKETLILFITLTLYWRILPWKSPCDERKLNSSRKVTADSIIYDLEDSVPVNRKGTARQLVFQALEQHDVGKSEKTVRINAVGSGLEVDDLSVVLRSKYVDALVVPKVQSAKELEFVSRMIDSIAPESSRANIRILACIESALGIMNIREIAQADPRIDGLVFAAEDYAADTGLIRTPSRQEFLYARQRVATAASAFGLQAIDMVCVDYQNVDILKEECREGREWGFTGKQAIHPKQLETIQRIYSPSEKDIERATKIVEGYQEHMKKGIGAFNLDGKMIDMPVVKWAERLLAKANMMKQ
ncbi:hypothetical protein SpCBS45565_g02544 [Spizellomyces sp. 'palustris']|nr:hypothetical protein SpCBS45565_g02544 [Spizellomyces sp. 'palustris']